jgi:hypothetical protein
MSLDSEMADLRYELVRLHGELVRYGLVAWTAGNVSARVPGTDQFLIKPSGSPAPLAATGARRATPRPTPTSTATCLRSAAWCTPTRRTPWRGRPVARRSRAC